jgi:1-acyl-sn-glycerol-3-phosphate acyltransferase
VLSWWGKLVFWFARANLWFWAKVLLRLRVTGQQHVPRTGAVLIVSNHVSHLDPPLVGLGVPRIVFHMAKKELFVLPALMWFMRTIGTIMVDRGQGRQALIDAVDYLNRDACVIIFPEGTRSQTGVLGRGHSGAIVIAARSNCTIVPAVITGSEKAMTKGSKLIRLVPVAVRFGPPYRIDYQGDPEEIPRELLRRETHNMMQRIEELLPSHMRPSTESKRQWYGELAAD